MPLGSTRRSFIAGLGSAACITCAQAQATEIRVAMLAPSALLWLHAVARDQGFYAKHGIAVRELVTNSSPALVQAIASGSVEAGFALGDVAMRGIDRGAPLVFAGGMLNKAILRLIGGPGIKDVKSLAGQPVTAGAVEGGTADLLRYYVKRAGGDPQSLRMVSLTNSKDRIVALSNGQVKAALLIAPFDTLAEREGMQVLDFYAEPYVETALVFNRDWAKKDRKSAVLLAQALREAAQWITTPANRDGAIKILADFTSTPTDIVSQSYAFIIEKLQAVDPGLRVPEAGLRNIVTISQDVGSLPAGDSFDFARYFDPTFLQP